MVLLPQPVVMVVASLVQSYMTAEEELAISITCTLRLAHSTSDTEGALERVRAAGGAEAASVLSLSTAGMAAAAVSSRARATPL